MYVDLFIAAIHSRNKIHVTFYSKEDDTNLVRMCAPMDFGPSRKAKMQDDRFHMWDYDSDTGRHTLSLPQDQIVNMDVTDLVFDPAEFVTWPPNWIVARDWGRFS